MGNPEKRGEMVESYTKGRASSLGTGDPSVTKVSGKWLELGTLCGFYTLVAPSVAIRTASYWSVAYGSWVSSPGCFVHLLHVLDRAWRSIDCLSKAGFTFWYKLVVVLWGIVYPCMRCLYQYSTLLAFARSTFMSFLHSLPPQMHGVWRNTGRILKWWSWPLHHHPVNLCVPAARPCCSTPPQNAQNGCQVGEGSRVVNSDCMQGEREREL